MSRRYFGTDGVRGAYGGPVVNEPFFARLGAAAGAWAGRRGAVLIGRDTRFSGPALAQALGRGLGAAGLEPRSLGVLPTPAVARAVREAGAVLGAVVTASHNPAGDNGVKFFQADGRKLADEEEARIEALLPEEPPAGPSPALAESRGALEAYVAAVSGLLPAGALRGWTVVLDTAHGATAETSPLVLQGLGARVIALGGAPDGRNINAGVGSEHPEALAARVAAAGARLGVAHDGDGDRCILCDELGAVLDGDEILTVLALDALERGALPANTLVVTVQSNLGVDAAVAAAGGRVVRAPVGDRYVVERMRAEGASLGGESSGHIVCAEISPAGDGLVAALKVMEVMRRTGRPLSELRRRLRKFPQASEAVAVREKIPLERMAALGAAIREVEAALGARGRVLVRYSGTEPKLRLLVEGPEEAGVRAALVRLRTAARADGA
ncbi:MAG TPA: phosphoglucosamine mutase [Opitutaceae bacterium]|nr:phosphoglucosamine mutase [Opitutaceae bacterium]